MKERSQLPKIGAVKCLFSVEGEKSLRSWAEALPFGGAYSGMGVSVWPAPGALIQAALGLALAE